VPKGVVANVTEEEELVIETSSRFELRSYPKADDEGALGNA
jgi:hypothetical protein